MENQDFIDDVKKNISYFGDSNNKYLLLHPNLHINCLLLDRCYRYKGKLNIHGNRSSSSHHFLPYQTFHGEPKTDGKSTPSNLCQAEYGFPINHLVLLCCRVPVRHTLAAPATTFRTPTQLLMLTDWLKRSRWIDKVATVQLACIVSQLNWTERQEDQMKLFEEIPLSTEIVKAVKWRREVGWRGNDRFNLQTCSSNLDDLDEVRRLGEEERVSGLNHCRTISRRSKDPITVGIFSSRQHQG